MHQQDRLSPWYVVRERRGHARHIRGAWAPKPVSTSAVCVFLAVMDAVVLTSAATAAYLVWLLDDPYSFWSNYALVVALGTLLAINIFHLARLYDPALLHRPRQMFGRTTACWCAVAATLMVVSFLSKTSDEYSRLWSLMWFGAAMVGLLATRWLLLARTAHWIAEGRLKRRVAIVGTGRLARRLAKHFSASQASGVRVVGLFAGREASHEPSRLRTRFGGGVDELIHLVRLEAVDTVIVAEEDASVEDLDTIFKRLREAPTDVCYCPGEMALQLARHNVSHCAGVAMINVIDRPLSEWRYVVKEIEDRGLATLILLLIWPVLMGIAALIKIDGPGPVLFRQKRYGYNNQLVEVWKFRTMHDDMRDPNAETLTQQNDPRITRVGAFLRRWSLDELPQFLNVLRGEMSIVGPRPHAVSAKAGGLLYQQAVPHYAARHRVKPGITGWAQINGWRGTTDTVHQIERRVEHDIYYIEHWSLWFDLKIIALTIVRGFSGQNVY